MTAGAPSRAAWWRGFPFLFGGTLVLLVFSLAAGWLVPGPAAWAVGFLYIGYDSWLLASMALAGRRAAREGSAPALVHGPLPTLTVLVAARNERAVLPACLAALEKQTAPAEEVVVVDDGSTDGTAAWMEKRYRLEPGGEAGLRRSATYPSLRLLAKAHSGKADSLNRAIRATDGSASGDVVVTLDADTLLEPGALAAVRAAFAADPRLAAACGILTPLCAEGAGAGGRLFAFYQRFEYLRGFLWRLAWMRRGMLLLVSGAFAAYRRPVLERLRGFDPASRVEDYDLIYRLHRLSYEEGLGWQTGIVPAARAVTDAPAAPLPFLRQRTRWFAGFLDTLFRGRDMVGNPRYGAVGLRMLPVKAADALLPLYALGAAILLGKLLVAGRGLPPLLWYVLGGKLLFDLVLHAWAARLYRRWQGLPPRGDLASLAATLTEPFAFQLLRHTGAALGWLAFLRGRIEWAPRAAVPAPETALD